MAIRLVIADDHPLILNSLANLFQLEKDFNLMATCANSDETLEAVHQHRPDVVILDVRMPGKDGLEITRELQAEKFPTRIIFYTGEINEDQYMEAVRLDVRGIVLKDMDPKHLLHCIRKVHAGEQWIERRIARLSLDTLLRRETTATEIASLITPRETGILRLIAKGLSNKQIGEKLFISEGTVKVHLHNIYEKLQVSSRVSLINYARERGFV